MMRFFHKKDMGKRVMSMVLAIVMVFTMFAAELPGSLLTVKAAETTQNVKIHVRVPNDWNWGTPYLWYGGGTATEVTSDGSAVVAPTTDFGWGTDKAYLMTEDASAAEGKDYKLYYIYLKGDFSNLQFLDINEDKTSVKNFVNNAYSAYMAQYAGDTATNLYYNCSTGKWYTDAACTTELTSSEPETNITVNLGIPTAWNWQRPAMQYWGCSTATLSGCGAAEAITGWTNAQGYPLEAAGEEAEISWYTITLKGTLTGIGTQFLDLNNPASNTGGSVFVNELLGDEYKGENPTNVYLSYVNGAWTWYKDKALTTPVVPPSTLSEQTITVHFNNSENWDKVVAYMGMTGSFNLMTYQSETVYAYAKQWPGAVVEADPDNTGWYSFKITTDPGEFALILNNGNGIQTQNITYTPENETTELWITLTSSTNNRTVNISETEPNGWTANTGTINPPVDPNANSTVVSPVLNADGTVTFNLDATGQYKDEEDIRLMGTLTGTNWQNGLAMVKDAENGVWTVKTPVQTPGVYGYKFWIPAKGNEGWFVDPMNKQTTGGNSKVVISGLENKQIDAKRGEATVLPKLNYYDAEGTVTEETPVYAVKDATLADVVTIADGKITVATGTTMDKVVLTASTKGTTSEVTVNVKDFVCNYTVYYYDYNEEHRTATAADVHVWEDGGGDIGDFKFEEVVTNLGDGNEWLKATFTTSATKIGLIPRSAGSWAWQTGNHYYENSAKAENVTIYIVYGDDANTYTSLPEIKEVRDRFAVIEYERSDSDYTGWNIYTWNSGFGSEVSKEIKDNNGKQDAIIPVYDVSTDFTLAFCMRKSEADNKWAKKDGGDHYLLIPADQLVVKAKFIQDKGIVEVLPYNTGYEMDAANDQIHFYYRDDELFKDNKEATLEGKVQVVIDGQAYAMAYDAASERYYYDAKGLVNGNHEYYYVVDGEKKLDAFNTKTNANETASVLTYKKFDNLGISATMYYPTMTYNDNNVVMVKLIGEDAANLTKSEIASVKVDCSALGTDTLDIVPQLMEGTISCLSTVKAGVKTLRVTVKDIYGNVCNTTVDVTVTDRTASTGDFDWDQSVIYFTVTDRFFDGSTANNSGVDKEGFLSYHGGDFVGLQAKLDYLQDLGINTIWITPIVANSDTVTEKEGKEIESTGYHGYWASDFTKLNFHLGTEEEFAALIKEIHAHGMKLMVDVVVNHAGYNTESYFNSILVDDATGESIAMIRDASNSVTGSDVYGSLAGLPDFVTENEEVRNQLVEWQVDWITKYDIDYFRVDTVKHVDTATWKAFKNALTKQNQDFKMIGEEAGSGYASNSVNLGTGSMDALLDFDTNGWMADYLTGNISTVESFMVKRNGAINNTKTLGQFLNSHDEDGLLYTLQKEKKLTEQQAADLMKVAATMTLTAKGIPVIYYGEELGLYGQNNYPYQTNRYDMDWALATKQQADASSVYNHYKTMLDIRKEYSQLFAKGNRVTVKASNVEGYDVFSRSYGDTTLYIGTNIKSEAKTVQIPVGGDKNTAYTDLYSNTLYAVNEDGMLDITIPAAKDGGTVVLVKSDDIRYVIPVNGNDFTEVVSTIEAVQEGETIAIIPADTEVIPGSVFEAMKNKDVNVIIRLEDGYWQINGKSITAIKDSINFNIQLGSNAVPADKVTTIAGGRKTLQLSLAHDGEFGMKAYLYVSVGTDYAGKFANLYYYNESKKELEHSQSVKVDENGTAGFSFVHASDYVIVFSDTSMAPEPEIQEPEIQEPENQEPEKQETVIAKKETTKKENQKKDNSKPENQETENLLAENPETENTKSENQAPEKQESKDTVSEEGVNNVDETGEAESNVSWFIIVIVLVLLAAGIIVVVYSMKKKKR